MVFLITIQIHLADMNYIDYVTTAATNEQATRKRAINFLSDFWEDQTRTDKHIPTRFWLTDGAEFVDLLCIQQVTLEEVFDRLCIDPAKKGKSMLKAVE